MEKYEQQPADEFAKDLHHEDEHHHDPHVAPVHHS
jgi:molybdopterin-containing oxidoreductase family membrane subunit